MAEEASMNPMEQAGKGLLTDVDKQTGESSM